MCHRNVTALLFFVWLTVCGGLTVCRAGDSETGSETTKASVAVETATSDGPSPVRVIFDTDIGNDVDDVMALAIIHAFVSRGEFDLLAVTSSNGSPIVVPFVQWINGVYGRPSIPVGLADQPAMTSDGTYMIPAAAESGIDLTAAVSSAEKDGRRPESAVPVLRRTLANAPDHSVLIFMTGFMTNLPRLLDSAPDDVSPLNGRELVEKKVDHLVVVGGAFTEEYKTLCENNIRFDLAAGRRLAEEWPTPIIWSGYEIGKRIILSLDDLNAACAGAPKFPVPASCRAYNCPMMALWDLVPPLLTARGDYFRLSDPGRVTVREDGTSFFTPGENGRDRIVLLSTAEEAARAAEAFRWLFSQPPAK